MKIYAKTDKLDLKNFDYYLNKPLWVLIESAGIRSWVKILKKGTDNRGVYYIVNSIFDRHVQHPAGIVTKDINKLRRFVADEDVHFYMWVDNSFIVKPIEVLTDDEMIDALTSENSV